MAGPLFHLGRSRARPRRSGRNGPAAKAGRRGHAASALPRPPGLRHSWEDRPMNDDAYKPELPVSPESEDQIIPHVEITHGKFIGAHVTEAGVGYAEGPPPALTLPAGKELDGLVDEVVFGTDRRANTPA